jgi:hypothetical protein
MNKIIKKVNKWLKEITKLLQNILVLSVIIGLLFDDPFGVLNTIGNLINNVGEMGLAGLISLALIVLIYRR